MISEVVGCNLCVGGGSWKLREEIVPSPHPTFDQKKKIVTMKTCPSPTVQLIHIKTQGSRGEG